MTVALPGRTPGRAPGRSVAIDAVRVLGIVAIVAGHVWGTNGAIRYLYAWHVPVFFFLTGYLWTPGRSLAHELGNQARTLLVPYVAWLLVIGSAMVVVDHHAGRSVLTRLRTEIWGGDHLTRPFTAFWFVTALFAVCVLRRLLETWRSELAVVTVLAIALAAAAYPLHDQLAGTPGSVGMALPALVFLVAGEWARRVQAQLRAPALLGAILVVATVAVLATTDVVVVDLKTGQLGTPVAGLVIALTLSWGLLLLAQGADSALALARTPILAVARIGILVILTHAVLLLALHTRPSGGLVDFLVALLVPIAVGLVVERTPLSRVLIAWPTQTAPRDRTPDPARTPSAQRVRRLRR